MVGINVRLPLHERPVAAQVLVSPEEGPVVVQLVAGVAFHESVTGNPALTVLGDGVGINIVGVVGVVTMISTVCDTGVPAVFEHVSVYDLSLVRAGVVKD